MTMPRCQSVRQCVPPTVRPSVRHSLGAWRQTCLAELTKCFSLLGIRRNDGRVTHRKKKLYQLIYKHTHKHTCHYKAAPAAAAAATAELEQAGRQVASRASTGVYDNGKSRKEIMSD
uniref:Uncharacterized protein n=1 Tax=Ceratitis capitata TaxID=7213 RepID=W8CDD7_CERCA